MYTYTHTHIYSNTYKQRTEFDPNGFELQWLLSREYLLEKLFEMGHLNAVNSTVKCAYWNYG